MSTSLEGLGALGRAGLGTLGSVVVGTTWDGLGALGSVVVGATWQGLGTLGSVVVGATWDGLGTLGSVLVGATWAGLDSFLGLASGCISGFVSIGPLGPGYPASPEAGIRPEIPKLIGTTGSALPFGAGVVAASSCFVSTGGKPRHCNG